MKAIGDTVSVALLAALSDAGLAATRIHRIAQNGAAIHETERQGRWK